MKKISRVLSVLLAILTVVMMLPLTALAEPWIGVDGSPADETEGSAARLTVTIDADRLVEILKNNGISSSLLEELKTGISVDQNAVFNIFTLDEIFEIVPQDKLLGAVDMDALLEQINITDYINVSELLANADVDVKALLELLPEGSRIEDYVDMSVLVRYVDPADAIGYVELDRLIAYVDIELFVEKAGSDLDRIVIFSNLFADNIVVLNDGAVSLQQILDAGLLTGDVLNDMVEQGAIRSDDVAGLFNDDLADPLSYFFADLLSEKVYPFINASDFTGVVSESDFRNFVADDILTDRIGADDVDADLVKGFIDYNLITSFVAYEKVTEYISADAVKQYIDPTCFTTDDVNIDLLVAGTDYTEDGLTQSGMNKISSDPERYLTASVWATVKSDPMSYLTSEGKTLVESDPTSYLTEAGKEQVNGDPYSFMNEEGKNAFRQDPLSLLTQNGKDAVEADPMAYLTKACRDDMAAHPDQYLTESGMQKLEDLIIDRVSISEIIETYQNVDGFTAAILECADLDRISTISGFSACVDYGKAISIVGIDNIINNPSITVDYSKLDLSALTSATDIDRYIRKDQLNLIPVADLTEIFGGEDNLMDCVDMDAAMADSELLNHIFESIQNDSSVSLDSVIDIARFLSAVDYMDVLELLGYESPLELLGNDAMMEILTTVDLTPYAQKILTVVLDSALGNIDLITLDGKVIAKEDPISATLAVDTEALVRAVAALIPTLNDLANMTDGNLLNTMLGITYLPETENAVSKTKNIQLNVVLEGNIERLKQVAAELDALLRKYIDFQICEDGSIYLGIVPPTLSIPAELTEVYRNLLNSELLDDAVKQKLLNFTNVGGVIGFADTLTLDDVVAVLKAVDVNALYNTFMNFSFIEAAIAKAEALTGYTLPDLTLDEMKTLLLESPSIDRICAKLQEKTGYQVRALLEQCADKFDAATENGRVQQMLTLISERLGYDLTDLSAADILENVSDLPLFETVANKVSEKIGKDILSVLEGNTVQELYDLAVAAASDRVGVYNKLVGYVDVLQSYLPATVMNYRIANSYVEGSSTFREDAKITVNAKSILQKAADKLTSLTDRISQDQVDFVMGYIPDQNVTVYVNVAVRVTDLYRITFKNREGTKTYTTVFMPVGTDLTIYRENLDLVGYQFTGWADENGNALDRMPDHDVVVHADLASAEVTILDTEGAFFTKLYTGIGDVLNAKSLRMVEEALLKNAPSDPVKKYSIRWLDKDGNTVDLYHTPITGNVTFRAMLVGTEQITVSGDVTDVTVGFDASKNQFYIRVHDSFESFDHFEIALDREHILERIVDLPAVSAAFAIYAVTDDGTEFCFLTLSTAQIQKLLDAIGSGDCVRLSYRRNRSGVQNVLYNGAIGNGVQLYSFTFGDQDGQILNVGAFGSGDVCITVPLFGKQYLDSEDRRTAVYFLTDSSRELQEIVSAENGFVSFYAPHFSDFAVGNEFAISASFYLSGTNEDMSDRCTLSLEAFYPESAVVTLNPNFDTSRYELAYITVNGTRIDGTSFTMPSEPVVLTVHLREKTANAQVLFLVNGSVVRTVSYQEISANFNEYLAQLYSEILANSDINAPIGYSKENAVWVYDETKLGIEPVYVTLKWDPITYRVVFASQETGFSYSYDYTIEDYQFLALPDVPEVEGKFGVWEAYDLTSLFGTELRVLKVNAVYTSKLYSIVINDPKNGVVIKQACMGESVMLGNFSNADLVAVTASGTSVAVDSDGNIVSMPAETVYVTVTYPPKTMTYLINSIAHKGIEGELIPIDIVLEPGQRLVSISDICTYIGSTTDSEGRTTLHYLVKLEGFVNVLYTVEGKASALFRILNGNLYTGTDDPLDLRSNVHFARWSEAIGSFSFAVYEVDRSESLLWLWILIAVLIVILLIVLIYLLYINGKLGVNLLTRAVAWIVGIFFMLCLAIARFGMKIGALFGKKDSVEEYGFSDPANKADVSENAPETEEEQGAKATANGKKKPITKGKSAKKMNHKKRHKLRKG